MAKSWFPAPRTLFRSAFARAGRLASLELLMQEAPDFE
jgi:hypothetical protein